MFSSNNIRDSSTHGHHQMVNTKIRLILCFATKYGKTLQSEKKNTRPGADCGSNHEPLIVKFRLKLKKVGKTTRQFRYDLNQIPYEYTMQVTNRFKGLDLVDRVSEELWTEVGYIVQEVVIKNHPQEKKMQTDKMVA